VHTLQVLLQLALVKQYHCAQHRNALATFDRTVPPTLFNDGRTAEKSGE
jgi:hypothetical protein